MASQTNSVASLNTKPSSEKYSKGLTVSKAHVYYIFTIIIFFKKEKKT